MSGERLPIWDDVNIRDALNEGRSLDDICCLSCPRCGAISYYNQGSGFSCRGCEASYYVCGENESPPDGPHIYADDLLTLQDVADAECSDYP